MTAASKKRKKTLSGATDTDAAPNTELSSEHFRVLVENASSGILVHRHLQPLYVNPALVKLFGYDSSEEIFALESVAELYAPEDRERLKYFHEARLRGDDAPDEYRLNGRRRDGTDMWLQNRPVRIDWDGGPAICTTLIEITERVIAEEQHRESEERFRDFARVASDWFWEMDADLRFTYFSERNREITGFEPENYIGKTRREIVNEATDNDKWEKHLAVLDARRPFSDFRYELLTSKGNTLKLSISGTPVLDEDGDFKGYRGTGTNVTDQEEAFEALRESEAKFRAFIGNSPAAIFLKDREGRYVLVNETYESWYQLKSEDLEGKTVRDRFSGEEADFLSELDRRAVEEREVSVNESEATHPDGVRRYTMVSRFPIIGPDDTVFGVGGVLTDVTGLKEAERNMRHAMQTAEIANRAKSEFLAHMSHELRTPLNSVIGFAQMMLAETFGPLGHVNYQDYSGDIHESAVHLLNVITDILDISKIEAGEMEITETEIELGSVILESTKMVSQRADRGGVILGMEIDQNLPCLRGDELRIKQIILNLLTNAIKFTPSFGRVTARAFLSDGSIVLQVADTGQGIPADQMPNILRPFEQVRDSSRHAHEGTGLGLYLTNSLVEVHGGELNIESELGVGTSVTIRFPLERTVAAP